MRLRDIATAAIAGAASGATVVYVALRRGYLDVTVNVDGLDGLADGGAAHIPHISTPDGVPDTDMGTHDDETETSTLLNGIGDGDLDALAEDMENLPISGIGEAMEMLEDASGGEDSEDDASDEVVGIFQQVAENPDDVAEAIAQSGFMEVVGQSFESAMEAADGESGGQERPDDDYYVGPDNPAPGTEKYREMQDETDDGSDPLGDET